MKNLDPFFKKRPEIVLAYLFGSRARGTQRPRSDTDLGVLLEKGFDQKRYLDFRLELLKDLDHFLGVENIDLVILNGAPPLLKFQVAKYGKIMFQRKGTSDVTFRARAFMEYMDIKPMLDFFTKDALRKIRGA